MTYVEIKAKISTTVPSIVGISDQCANQSWV